ncbi:MAG: beta-glucuronidase [Planctomycetes bacterium GWF2_41_51]|nr:MAG: beta-glucuronidase [Planctomycetes bacterium GWF2_41_51]HBG28551.1 beta-glucuronidase [Phycisphaerales bacterium]
MLYPKENHCREMKELNGFWDYKFDWTESGQKEEWYKVFKKDGQLPVPSSWNELFADDESKHFLGTCWYQTTTFVPESWQGKNIWIWVGSVSYRAKVWINGKYVGSYEGCHLPFQFTCQQYIKYGQENCITIAVNAELNKNTIPPGNLNQGIKGFKTMPKATNRPDVGFDFFPFGGIHRPVRLYTTSEDYIEDVTVVTDYQGKTGKVDITVNISNKKADTLKISVGEYGKTININNKNALKATIEIPNVELWSTQKPHLYACNIKLLENEKLLDEYVLSVGVRTVQVKGTQILLNGKPIYLKGFGKHEDFHLIGRGLNHAVIKRDYELMKWIGANSFRTSHYPYSEEMLEYADREGFLVIAETAAVEIRFKYNMDKLLENHKKAIRDLMKRDKNHPSIIMWSVANEPGSEAKESRKYFKEIMRFAKSFDSTRPFTIVSCDGEWIPRGKCNIMDLCDVICLNRYYAWYAAPAYIKESIQAFSEELDDIYNEYKKPIMLTEFGADAVAGLHSMPEMIYSEEFQAKIIEEKIKIMRSKKFMVGEHIWNFADFLTGQSAMRVCGNKKGVFTRDRQPKLAAHVVRQLWRNK